MKQIAQYQDGRLEIQDVPEPTAPPGGVLVRTTHSVISVGTEKMKVEQAKMSLLQKAKARPDQVRKVLDTARTLGWKSALAKVRNRLETPTPLGYSAAGVVVAVDSANTRFKIGDRVACAGAECAFHAEYIALPDMLVAPVPAGVENWQAGYTTIASIALQAVRQTEPRIGERVLVIGQGLVGLLVTNILHANGARVMAVDLQPSRRELARSMGAERVVIPGEQNLANELREWTEGFGVDAAIVCTATQSNTPIEQAAEALRDRGRLVDVGITRIELPWKLFYEKELDVRFSRSYGPGRYDPAYEWGGVDYPIGYVRWTEQRNFQACLHLMKTGQLNLAALTTRRVPFSESLNVYASLLQNSSSDVGVVLEFEDTKSSESATKPLAARKAPTSEITSSVSVKEPVSRLDVIGAGNFARTMLLPHLKSRLDLGTVVNNTALSAKHVQSKFGFESASTDCSGLFNSGKQVALLIATRHHLHAPLVQSGLKSNKHIFVEKPLCLTRQELSDIDKVIPQSDGSVQVGFNRRFAPATAELKKQLSSISGPKSATIRIFAGKLDPSHWYANYHESGGRVLGEACHFFDYLCFLFEAKPIRVFAQTIGVPAGKLPFPDSVCAQIEFTDGSSGQVIYTAEGDYSYPKESISVFGAGIVADITNFQKLTIHRGRKTRQWSFTSKGHAEQMDAWASFLRGNRKHPLPYDQSRTSMMLTFAVLESIQQARSVDV